MKVLILAVLFVSIASAQTTPTYTAPVPPTLWNQTDMSASTAANGNIFTAILLKDSWNNGMLLQHDLDIWTLKRNLAQAQTDIANLKVAVAALQGTPTQPPAPTSLTNPTLVAGSGVITGTLITQTNPGTVYNWAFNAPAKAYTVTITGAGPGSLQPLVNGAQVGTPLKFPASTLGAQSVSITWPGGQGSIGFAWSGGWVNVSTTLTVQ